ncbi:9474_t:CDS:2 [Entrophospora sp. SA101]|nr:6394_t:CDS:2 [Entrophospora sp. SA101]CAJ0757563.1 9474_t:CDS:2 [Entrophospora sp. SA101]CAJ0843125.1 8297_t:CDS:2 [Entrophospora sp. SA101]
MPKIVKEKSKSHSSPYRSDSKSLTIATASIDLESTPIKAEVLKSFESPLIKEEETNLALNNKIGIETDDKSNNAFNDLPVSSEISSYYYKPFMWQIDYYLSMSPNIKSENITQSKNDKKNVINVGVDNNFNLKSEISTKSSRLNFNIITTETVREKVKEEDISKGVRGNGAKNAAQILEISSHTVTTKKFSGSLLADYAMLLLTGQEIIKNDSVSW